MSSMFNPPQPGLTLRDDILPALNLQVGEAVAQLGVYRTTLSKVLHWRAAISPAMALRIEPWLGREHVGAAEEQTNDWPSIKNRHPRVPAR